MLAWFFANWVWIAGTLTLVVMLLWATRFLYERKKYNELKKCFAQSISLSSSDIIKHNEDLELTIIRPDEPAWHNLLEDELDRMPIGRISFNPPESMKVGIKERAEVRISKDYSADITAALKGEGVAQIDDIKVSDLMKVRLSGNDFTIASLNEEEQVISKNGYTEWAWDILPNKSGEKTLHLHVTLRIRLPFGEEKKDFPVLDRDVSVKINPSYSIKIFLLTYWKWVLTAMVIPLIGLIWNMHFK